ncbi:putative P-loop ATPase/GTPase [Halalkaliarchaeum sp. AArc-CO]|uniref:ATPase n=1 Tax=unclassified Halalkaliarchaeum TaxID=2678344 RepID=UPI00217CD6F5|nr:MULTISPECIES: ATPase [unclassified Halalkaliarchaeum]MDR5674529.1 ATPase [Halalkaliarchaeum sp. AArc-GB]UWG50361.1 putative P-loop ATPase/GTPase [Halalkaliarchaeum sp. AArc-CO]
MSPMNSQPTVLVVGDARVDAGKTTFSVGLLDRLGKATARGEPSPVGFKPRAGNDYWFDHDDVRAAIEEGQLYGKDARRLAETSGGFDSSGVPSAIERINPVHRLWRPTPGRTGMLGEADRTALVDRVTLGGETTYLVNGAAEVEGLIPAPISERLSLADARRVGSVAEFNEAMRELHLPAFDRLADRIATVDGTRPVVIESYGDIAVPLQNMREVIELDVVAAVAPSRLRVYRGDRWLRARSVASGSPREGRLEERTARVAEMVEPVATRELPALPSRVRADAGGIAEAYADAYEAVLEQVKPDRG